MSEKLGTDSNSADLRVRDFTDLARQHANEVESYSQLREVATRKTKAQQTIAARFYLELASILYNREDICIGLARRGFAITSSDSSLLWGCMAEWIQNPDTVDANIPDFVKQIPEEVLHPVTKKQISYRLLESWGRRQWL